MTIDATKFPNSGGLIINQYFGVYAHTDSVDTITGAIVTLGGMGVAGNINIGGNIGTSGDINTSSNVTVGSNLVVSGNTILKGNLSLVGQSQFTGNMSLAGNLFLTSASGTAYINGNPVVTAGTSGTTAISAITLASTDDPGSLADATTAFKNSGGATIAKRLFVGGNVVLSSGTATPTSSAFAGHDSSVGALVVKGGTTIVGNLVIGGKYGTNFADGPTDSTDASTGTLQVNGGAAILGQMNVTGPITLNSGTSGGVTYTGGLLLSLPTGAGFPSGVSASSGTDLQIGAGGANYGIFISKTTANIVVVPSTATQSTTTGALVVKGGLGISGGIQAGGNIVAVATTQTSTVNTGSIVAKGGAGINGVLIVGGNVVASASTASSSTTTGALVVTGGAGIGGSVNVGGTINAAQQTKVSSDTGTPGQICWDANYIYVCTATNVWKRAALTAY